MPAKDLGGFGQSTMVGSAVGRRREFPKSAGQLYAAGSKWHEQTLLDPMLSCVRSLRLRLTTHFFRLEKKLKMKINMH